MKGHKYSMGGTKGRIESDMRRHRKAGGSVESAKSGDDDAAKDVKDTPNKRLAPNKVYDEAEEKKAKRGGKIEGKKCRANGGRLPRASGGGCESNPFTSANKGTPAVGRSVDKVTMGSN